jgi:SusD family.
MNIKKYFLLVCAGLVLISSCSKDFLDEVKPADGSMSSDLIFSSKIGVENALTGIYGLLQSYVVPGGRQNMYGVKTIMFNFDIRGNDLIADPSNWWTYENDWADNTYGRVATASRTLHIWNMFYQVINNANAIIEQTPNIPESKSVQDALIGEARALRAYAYFWLARVYQFTYAKDPNAPGIPIYTSPASGGSTGNPRASLTDVYDLIVEDLKFAVENMSSDRVDKYRINKNVAQGILAEVYQEMAMAQPDLWDDAVQNAADALNGFELMTAGEYRSGFNSVNNREWMWGLQFNASQSLSYASFFGYIDPTPANVRYKCIYVNSSFVDLFSETDIRNLFDTTDVLNAANPWQFWRTYKFIDNSSFSGDHVMMRAAEMHLIIAEGLAQMNQLEDAKDALYVLQLNRDPNAVRSTAATKEDLINEILVERRKELYGEIGVEYFDLKRYQRPLKRDGNQWSLKEIPANDNRWRWQIPQSEMDANKSLTAADQNPL